MLRRLIYHFILLKSNHLRNNKFNWCFKSPLRDLQLPATIGSSLLGLWEILNPDRPEDGTQVYKRRQIKAADSLCTQNRHQDICDMLQPYRRSKDVEVLWRLSRAKFNLSLHEGLNWAERSILIMEAYNLISAALVLDDSHYAVHKWMAIILYAKCGLEGTKSRIAILEEVKGHLMRAVELNPKDATTFHLLGVWCYRLADLNWFERKLATFMFQEPPVSTFSEALSYLVQAEEAHPLFYRFTDKFTDLQTLRSHMSKLLSLVFSHGTNAQTVASILLSSVSAQAPSMQAPQTDQLPQLHSDCYDHESAN